MKLYIYSILTTTLFAVNLLCAQEMRAPIEKYDFDVEASSTSDITVAIDTSGRVAVWSKYSEKRDDRTKTVTFKAKKFQVFDHGKSIKIVQELKDIPRRDSVGVKEVSFLDGIEWTPSGGIERDNKIIFKGMAKLGFTSDSFVLGPFEYTIVWAKPIGLSKRGFMYVVAECNKPVDTSKSGPENQRVFKMLYKLSKAGQVIDSFVFSEAKFVMKTGMGARYPWEWSRGIAQIDEEGQLYTVTTIPSARNGQRKVTIEQWGTK